MITPELLEFLRTQHAEGMSLEEMEHLLVTEGGWTTEDVTEAFRQIGVLPVAQEVAVLSPLSQTAPETAETPSINTSVVTAPETVEEPRQVVEAVSLVDRVETSPLQTQPPMTVPQVAQESETSIVSPLSEDVPLLASVVEEKAEESKAVELSVSRTPSEPKAEPEQVEDFLGIFSEVKSEPETPVPSFVTPAVETILETPSVSVSAPLSITPSEADVATPIQEHIDSLAQDVSAVGGVAGEVPVLSPDVTPLVFGKKPEWSFQDMLAQKKLSPQDDMTIVTADGASQELSIPKEEASGIQFDLSRVDAPGGKTPPVNDTPSAPVAPKVVARPVQTKSVAELWLAGTNQSEKPVTPYSSSTPRATLSARRTMNSDLLRGKGESIRSMPALSSENLPSPAELPRTPVPEVVAPPVVKSPVVTTQSSPTLAEDLKRKNNIKRVVTVSIGVLVVLLVLGIAVVLLISNRGLGVSERLSSGLSQFAGATTFSYSGEGFANFVLSTPASGDGVARNGLVNFVLKYSGALQNSANGYGDGSHRIKLTGGLQSGNFAWNTDVESDVRVIGSTLYFHLLSYPAASEFDPEVMKSYWIKIDLAALTKELALSAGNTAGQGYGSFGSGKSDMAFNKLYADNLPFELDDMLDDEAVNGVLMTHMKLKANKERMYIFALKLYKKYTGNELVLSAEQQLRLKDALGKIRGEAWMDKMTNQLAKVMVRGDFDDDMVSAHVKGNTQLTFTLADQGKEVSVSEPTPFLTLEEFRARTDEYKKNKELRANDSVKLLGLEKIVSALAVYQKEKGRYPATLLDLRSSGKLPTSVLDEFAIKQFSYASYLKPEVLSKSGRCTSKGKICAFYHLGVNFEDLTNPALTSDADATSEISGRDTTGCGSEMNLSCFDVVSTSLSTGTTTTQTASSTTR